MTYHIWDQGNRLGEFETRRRALEAVRAIVTDDPSAGQTLVLVAEGEAGYSSLVAAGADLANLVHQREYA